MSVKAYVCIWLEGWSKGEAVMISKAMWLCVLRANVGLLVRVYMLSKY